MLRSLLQGLSPDEMGELIEELKTGEEMETIQEEGGNNNNISKL